MTLKLEQKSSFLDRHELGKDFNHYNPKATVARTDIIKTSTMKIQSNIKSTS